MLIISHYIPEKTLAHDLTRDSGIAFTVSVCITLVIEYHMAIRRETEAEWREAIAQGGVLDGVFGKIVPPEVWNEIKTHLLETAALCEKWNLTIMQISREPVTSGGSTEDHYVATGILSYTLVSQVTKERPIFLSHELESKVEGTLSDETQFLLSTS